MAHTFTNLLTHAIFSTHGRIPSILDTTRADLHSYLGGISFLKRHGMNFDERYVWR